MYRTQEKFPTSIHYEVMVFQLFKWRTSWIAISENQLDMMATQVILLLHGITYS